MKIIYLQVFGGLLLMGCGSQRDEVPGNIAPGSIEDVTRRIPEATTGADEPITPRCLPTFMEGEPASLPLLTPPRLISFYVFPRRSRDGQCYRDGVWIHRVITPFSWEIDHLLHDDRLKLSTLPALHVDGQGRLITEMPGNSAGGVPASARTFPAESTLPWREQTGIQGQTRTTVIYPNSGTAVSTIAPTSQAPTYIGANGAVNMQEVQHAMQEAQQRVRELQLSRAPAGGSVPASTSISVSVPAPPSPESAPAMQSSLPVAPEDGIQTGANALIGGP